MCIVMVLQWLPDKCFFIFMLCSLPLPLSLSTFVYLLYSIFALSLFLYICGLPSLSVSSVQVRLLSLRGSGMGTRSGEVKVRILQ